MVNSYWVLIMKKTDGQKAHKKSEQIGECDLDKGYVSPVHSFRDLSIKNLHSLIISSRYIQILILLTLTGLFLRIYNLGYNSLWLDEATTYFTSIESFGEIWQSGISQFSPPLFLWVEHGILILGNSEFILRIIPALLGVLTIPLFYLVGKEFCDRNAGLIAAAACSVSPFLIFYSQEARAYAMLLFFMALATLFFLKALKSDRLIHFVLFGIFSALALWTHYYAIVMIAALVVYALLEWLPKIRSHIHSLKLLSAGIVTFVILSSPLLLFSLQLFITRTGSAPTYGIQGLNLILETFVQMSGFGVNIAVFVMIVLFIVGIIQAFRSEVNKGVFLVLLTVLIFGISYLLSFKMPMIPRYLISLSIVFFMGIALSYRLFYSFWRSKAVVYGLIVLLVIISIPTLTGYYSGYSKEDWKGFSTALQQKSMPGDIIISVPGYISQPLDYYYSSTKAQTKEYGATTANDLNMVMTENKNSTKYFIVTGDITAADPNGDAILWIRNNTRLVGTDVTQQIYLFTNS